MKAEFAVVAAAAALALAALPASAKPQDASHFLTDAMQGDNSEMILGQLAAQKGASPGLRAFGQTLHDDHAKARGDAGRVATQMGVPQTDKPMPEAVAERTKLEGMSGAAFDHEFASYMVKDHTKDIAEFRQAEKLGGPAGTLAKNTLPTLEKHLAMAKKQER